MTVIYPQRIGFPSTKKIQDRIIVKFVCRDVREEVYKNRKALHGKLTDCLPSVNAEIGKNVPQATKIFINESLTTYGCEILIGQTYGFDLYIILQ